MGSSLGSPCLGHVISAYLGGQRSRHSSPAPWPVQVFVMEDDDGRMHVRNLSAHRTSNEEEALNLVGGACRGPVGANEMQ